MTTWRKLLRIRQGPGRITSSEESKRNNAHNEVATLQFHKLEGSTTPASGKWRLSVRTRGCTLTTCTCCKPDYTVIVMNYKTIGCNFTNAVIECPKTFFVLTFKGSLNLMIDGFSVLDLFWVLTEHFEPWSLSASNARWVISQAIRMTHGTFISNSQCRVTVGCTSDVSYVTWHRLQFAIQWQQVWHTKCMRSRRCCSDILYTRPM